MKENVSGAPEKKVEKRYSACIVRHAQNIIWGNCVDLTDKANPITLGFYWEDRLLRNIEAKSGNFGFLLREDFVRLLPEGTFIDVRLPNGESLVRDNPISQIAIGEAQDGGAALTDKFDKGYVLDKWGSLILPFSAKSTSEREGYASGMFNLAGYFKERFGLTLFPHYGTLLGYARSKSFLSHDDDTDMSYVSRASSVEEAVDEFFQIVDTARADGHRVHITDAGQANIALKDSGDMGADVFVTWHQDDGSFFTYFGVVGNISDKIDFITDEMEGVEVNIPKNYENILALTYGPNWRIPDPGFRWVNIPEEPTNSFRAAGSERLKNYL